MKKLSFGLILSFSYILSSQAGMWNSTIHSEEDSYYQLARQVNCDDSHCEKKETKFFVWNIFKGDKKKFSEEWEKLQQQERPDVVLFQESIMNDGPYLCMEQSDCDMGISFEYEIDGIAQYTGVMISSLLPMGTGQTLLSDSREPVLKTPKSTLISKVFIEGREVMVVNTHAINFVTLNAFDIQMKEIELTLKEFEGPILWAGDFNTWAIGRLYILQDLTKRLGMEDVKFENDHYIKRALGLKLDHVFTRGMEIKRARALKSEGSDHNPLVLDISLI